MVFLLKTGALIGLWSMEQLLIVNQLFHFLHSLKKIMLQKNHLEKNHLEKEIEKSTSRKRNTSKKKIYLERIFKKEFPSSPSYLTTKKKKI